MPTATAAAAHGGAETVTEIALEAFIRTHQASRNC